MASPRIRFWFRWTLATAAGVVLARLAYLFIIFPLLRWLTENPAQTYGQLEIVRQLQTAMRWSDAVLAAMIIALVQVQVLRRVLRAAPAWIVASALGAIVVLMARLLLIGMFRPSDPLRVPSQATLLAVATLGAAGAAFIASGIQWVMVLRRHDRFGLYIVASVLAAVAGNSYGFATRFGPADPLSFATHTLLNGAAPASSRER